MSSQDPSAQSGRKKVGISKAIVILCCLVAAAGAGIVLQRARATKQAAVEPAGPMRFAGRTGGSVTLPPGVPQSKPSQFLSQSQTNPDGTITGGKIVTDVGIQRTVAEIMTAQSSRTGPSSPRIKPEREVEVDNKAENPDAPAVSQWPDPLKIQSRQTAPKIHTTGLSFDGATLTDTGAFPPDSMGAVGPTQFVTFVNGRIRTFTKAGVADGVINADPDVFFASVKTPVAGAVVLDFTSDPNVRYDRFTGRWYMTIIDVPCTNATCTTTAANRVLIAVSDAASNGVISASTVWTFFQFQGDPGTNFLDYPSLGIDVNALYIGGNMFSSAGSFVGTNGYVVRKSTTLGAGPLTVTMFANFVSGAAGSGPFAPRGVDNFDSTATEGYFVGPDNATFSTIMFRRVSNPGSATPTVSANISVTVPTTTLSGTQTIRLVQHAGNTGGNNGLLDTLDDRLYQAMIRNGRLWSAHNFTVGTTGVASTASASRYAARWYEFQSLSSTPTLVQSGTVFDNAATRAAARQYWIPSVLVTGQGHAVMGMTMAGTPVGATPVYVGRLSGDTLGTMTGPPTTAAVSYGTTTANYNPPSDPGGSSGRRWGDYSHTSLDPLDDMTVWTIQEYNQASNSYAVRVGKLLAPPPATPTCSGSPITFNGPTGNVVINATSSGGSGFYDPGANLPAPARPFNHLSATVTNATVNSVTYNSPTQATLNITALATGSQNVTITNPDGQSVTANGCINVLSAAVADLGITKTDGVTTAVPGGSVTYTITASNASATPATGATVADTFPAVLACTWTCVGAGGGTCTASGSGNINDTVNLPAGASVTYTASCAISAAATGTLSNTATVTIAGDPNAANNSATDTDTLAPQANLGITKTDGVTSVTAGGSTTYTITASNAGPSNAPGATVADTFPASLTCTWTCVGAGGGTCTASGSGNINNTVNLPSGGSVTYTASCTISASATGTLSNTATVAAPGGVTDPTPGNNSATDSDTIAASADLAITKTDGVTTATPGGSVTYTITASNAGPSNASGATVADTFPASLTCTWTCVGAGGGTCTASGSGNISDTVNLPSGGSVTYTASCSISASATGTLSNTATVAAPGGVTDPTPGNNSATDTDTLSPSADLSITKTDGVTTATPGGSVTYTITASNTGPSNATGATVADTFPASLTCTWTCVGAGGGTCTASGSGNINNTVNLPSGGSVTYTASCNISAAATGTLSNTATVAAPGGVTDPTPGNNSATDSDTLGASADLSITKTDGVTTVTAGGSTTYTITAANAGPSNATGATVADTFPAALTCTWTCVGAGGGTCTASGSGNINNTVNLPAGGSVTYTASCTISANASGTLSNTATVAAPGGVTDPTPGNNSATDTDSIQVICPSTLTVNDLGDTPDANPGDRVCNDGTGKCTLRAAVMEANAITACSPLTINFSVTGTINLATALPALNHPNLTITGPGANLLDVHRNAAGNFRIFAINSGKTVAISGLTISNGNVAGVDGGGVFSSGALTLTNCALTGNQTDGEGGGVYSTLTGSLTLTGCTISGNTANKGGGISSGAVSSLIINITNATISGNTATTTGGGIGLDDSGVTMNLLNVTIANNQATTSGGGINRSAGTLNFKNTIVAGNTAPAGADISGAVVSQDFNLIGVTAGATISGTTTNNITGAPALLAPLGNYGGPTQTQALLPGSPAINVGTNTGAPATDQRGIARPQQTTTDIGAFESRGFTLAIVSGNNQSTLLGSPFALPLLVSVTANGAGEPVNGGLVTFTPPGSGASATLVTSPATISGGQASVTATANNTSGTYSVSADANGGNSVSFTLTNNCPTFTISPSPLPSGVAGTPYSQTLTASPAGSAPFTFALTGGALPPGTTLTNAGVLSGTPTAAGTFNFTVTVTGNGGNCSTVVPMSVTIGCPTITLSPTSLPNGTVGQAYPQSVSATPAGGNYTFAVTGGTLPNGLTLNSNGTFSGTPSVNGTFNFRVTATGFGTCTGFRDYTVTIGCAGVTLNPSSLPAGMAGISYSQTITASPAGSYTYNLSAGALPSGLALNPSTGVISGLPLVAGTYSFTIRADAGGCSVTQNYTLQINCPTITISPASLPNGTVGTAYSQTISATPAGGNYTFGLTGALPSGLILNSATGVISGTPTINGSFSFTVTATGFGSCAGTKAYTIVIGSGSCPTITLPASLPGGTVGQVYSQSVAASPADNYTYSQTGTLPPGVSFINSVPLLFGYPTAAGSYTFTITATLGACTGTQTYTVVIGAPAFAKIGDFDGDGKTDFTVWRGMQSTWMISQSSNGQVQNVTWGAEYAPYNDITVPGDYDGDGKTDVAVFRRGSFGNGHWYIKRSSDGATVDKYWGVGTDVAVPADYDGDGKTDIAVWRASEGRWYILRSSDGTTQTVVWGGGYAPYNDVPVPADYDGDGKTDIAVFRTGNGHWYIQRSSDGAMVDKYWGLGTDVPVPADYDGDGKADIAVWRGSDTNWYVVRSGDNKVQTVSWGASSYGDLPTPGDYDGDGKADIAIWRASTGTWYVRSSRDDSVITRANGQAGDRPISTKSN